MNRKLKLALAALLGFSTACSTVRNAPKGESEQKQDADTTQVKGSGSYPPRIMLMYGVPTPRQDSIRRNRMNRLERQLPDSLPPVAEKPAEEDVPAPNDRP